MSKQISPRPWRFEDCAIYDANDVPVVWPMGGIENPADGRLMAAAPDLLAQCLTFREWYVTEWGEAELQKDFPGLDATITKAKESKP